MQGRYMGDAGEIQGRYRGDKGLLLHRGLYLLVEDVDALDRRVQPGHRRGAALVVGAQPRLGLR